MQTKGCQLEIKPDNLPPVDVIGKLEERFEKIEEQNEYIQERFSDMTSQIITNEYGNDEYMDEQKQEMKREIVIFLNKLFVTFNSKEDGQREKYPPDTTFQFTRTGDNVSVETEVKEEIYIEEKEEIKPLSCDICGIKFKSLANLNRHDQKVHLRQGTDKEFKCDLRKETK